MVEERDGLRMKKLKLYLETSVWNFLVSEKVPGKRRITEKLFDEIGRGKYEIYISEFVYHEIRKSPEFRREQLEKIIKRHGPILLETDSLFDSLAQKYLQARFIPEKHRTDTLHLSIASVNDMDIVISWNMKHIVKLKTKRCTNSINTSQGYKTIEILTPEEVIDYD